MKSIAIQVLIYIGNILTVFLKKNCLKISDNLQKEYFHS